MRCGHARLIVVCCMGVSPGADAQCSGLFRCNCRLPYPNKQGCGRPCRFKEFDVKIALIILLIVGGLVIAGALIAGPQLQSGLASFAPKPQGTKVRMQKVAPGKLMNRYAQPAIASKPIAHVARGPKMR